MNEVRQLAFAFPSFPGGTHTRLAHSLGVAHLAGMTTRRVLERGSVYSRNGDAPHRLSVEEQRRLINLATAAGLVHDVGHTPLGHSLDRFFGRKHKVGNAIADKKFLPELIARLKEPLEAVEGVRVQDVVTVLSKGAHELHGWHQFISSLLDSDLDVDRLDYLQRDAHFTGQQEGLLSFEKIIDAVRPFDLDERIYLAFDEEAINDIDQFVYARDAMYLRCYEYRTKIVSEWLTQHAINELFQQHAGLDGVINEFALLSDGQLLDLIMESGQVHVIETISRVFRSEACAYAEVFAVGFRKRHLRARLATLQEDFTVSEETLLDKVAGLETEVAATAGISRDDIVITLPDLRLAADEREPGLDIWIMTRRAGGGHEIVPMLDEEDEASPSDLLRRRKYVPLERVLSADDLQQLKQQARAEGFSLLRLLRDARYKIHVFLHRRSMDKKDAVVDAFRACGVIADA
jgi:HD superfamily phosphohydrolase